MNVWEQIRIALRDEPIADWKTELARIAALRAELEGSCGHTT